MKKRILYTVLLAAGLAFSDLLFNAWAFDARVSRK